jgi:hypothetical protein
MRPPEMKKNKDLLTYYREVLDKISTADARTFRKELRKAFRALLPEERKALKEWYRSSCACRVESVLPMRVQRTGPFS